MERPREQHLMAAKRILRYVQGTIGFGIQYQCGIEERLVGYVDSDYAGDIDDRRSTSLSCLVKETSFLGIQEATYCHSLNY